jgi:hypothetical protein
MDCQRVRVVLDMVTQLKWISVLLISTLVFTIIVLSEVKMNTEGSRRYCVAEIIVNYTAPDGNHTITRVVLSDRNTVTGTTESGSVTTDDTWKTADDVSTKTSKSVTNTTVVTTEESVTTDVTTEESVTTVVTTEETNTTVVTTDVTTEESVTTVVTTEEINTTDVTTEETNTTVVATEEINTTDDSDYEYDGDELRKSAG